MYMEKYSVILYVKYMRIFSEFCSLKSCILKQHAANDAKEKT